ncbi:MAG: CHASE2 domain-containing protein [Pseudomonadales bacterium]
MRTLPSREAMVVSALLTAVAAMLGYFDRPLGLNNVFYDTIQKLQTQQKPDDVLVIAIDEASLLELGKWPWRRGLHAQAIDTLTRANVKAIASDILFTEHDTANPTEDDALVDAVRRNGNTVVPMFIGELRDDGQVLETLPFSELIDAAKGIGHVHVELDTDGIWRSVFLKEGVGKPYWPHLSVVLYEAVHGKPPEPLPGLVSKTSSNAPMQIARDYLNRIRYSVGPGKFKSISFIDLINNRIPTEELQDKIVFLGMTAAGMSDTFATPISQEQLHMKGVEVQANIFHALRSGTLIKPLSPWQNAFAAGLLTFAGVLCITVLKPHHSSMAAIIAILLVPLFSFMLLRFGSVWMAPAASFIMLCLAYPLWSWRRLEQSMQYLGGELASLEKEPGFLNEKPQLSQLNSGLHFLTKWLPIKAWRVEKLEDSDPVAVAEVWQHSNDKSTFLLNDGGEVSSIAIEWRPNADIDIRDRDAFLGDLVQPWHNNNDELPTRHRDIVADYIERIQSNSAAGRQLRNFIYSCLSNLQDGIVVTSLSGRVIMINDQARRLLGISEEAYLSASFTDLLDRSMRSSNDVWEEALQGLYLRGIDTHFEALTKPDYSVLVQGKKFELDTSADVVVIFTFTDVSELKELERARAETLNFVSHDLRSPLVSILALVDQAEHSDALGPIKNYTERALSYTEGFLQLARAESGEASLYECDMHAILDNACEHVFELAAKKKISLRREHCKQSAWVWGNADLLERMLINLLDNAIKYSHEHDVVDTRLAVANNKVSLYVIDHGIGIPADDIPILFEQFRRGSSRDSRSQSGAGLGLRFVAVTLQRHNGAVKVNSAPGRGSEFMISLPRLELRDDYE